MIKGLLVYINIIFFSLLGFFSEDAVTVDSKLPATANPGEAFEVEVTIKKGSITEFAKFQYILPVGFTAENIDSKTGSFTFAQQQVKIIWMALPSEPEFKIKFRVKTFPSTNGTYNLSGKFYYVLQGTKYEANTPVKTITIGTASAVAITPKNNDTTTPDTKDNTAAAKDNNIAQNPQTKDNTTTVSIEGVELKRTLSATQVKKGGSFMVDLVINKGSISGFAKVMETLPVGFTAEEVDAFGGVFSFQDNKVKILWMTMPASKEIKVKYKVTVTGDLKGKQTIEGFFQYLKESDGSNPKAAFNISEISVVDQITEDTIAIVDPKIEDKQKPEKDPVKDKDPSAKDPGVKVVKEGGDEVKIAKKKPVKKEPIDNTATASANPDFGISNPNQNLYYSVQICATKKQVDISYFVKTNNINEKIYTMMHEGWHKYVVGEFSVYKDARDHREVVKTENKVVGPFVTAYNKGVRITVQEALMISGQKWIQ